jgi:hypothetical protein
LGLILDLFSWWGITVSWSIAFMIAIGIYLYRSSRAERKEDDQKRSLTKLLTDFTFTWILLGLLIFYIISIKIGSSTIFAIGNIVFEAILILYGIKSRGKASSQKETPRQRAQQAEPEFPS